MIGKALRYLRNKNNLNQESLAKFLNIKQNTLSRYETNTADPSFETIEKIANKCGYKIYFINEKTNDKFQIKDLERKDV